MTKTLQKLKVFLCHASENKPIVQGLYDRLKSDGFDPWLDSEFLLPGMDWDLEIQQAMRASDAVIVCLSEISVKKEGYIQKEIKYAQEILKEKPEGTIFLLPVQLEECVIPFSLQAVQWGKYHELGGYKKIVKSLTIRAKQLDREIKETDDAKFKGLPPGSYIPFPRNALFTGREADLKKLSALCEPNASNIVISQAITGMGGIGKTQLAVEFAYRYGHKFKGVHWLDLRDPDSLDASVALCGSHMGLAFTEQPEQVANTLRQWQSDIPRLLILDNFEDVTKTGYVLSRFQYQGLRLLITSRRKDFPKSAGLHTQALDTFNEIESLEFLEKTLEHEETKKARKLLSNRLGHLPLALELAASYININNLDIAGYLKELVDILTHESMEEEWFKELDITTPTAHDQSLIMTFHLTWQELKDETTQMIFMLAGYCSPNIIIPPLLLIEALAIDNKIFNKSFFRLISLGMLVRVRGSPVIHPILAAYARKIVRESTKIDKVEILSMLGNALCNIANKAISTGNPSNFSPLVSHAKIIVPKLSEYLPEIAGRLLSYLGLYFRAIAAYKDVASYETIAAYEQAKYFTLQALKMDQELLGVDHPNIAAHCYNLGVIYYDIGDLKQAHESFVKAKSIWESNYNDHLQDIAKVANKMGIVFQDMGNLIDARSAYEQSLEINENLLGSNHPTLGNQINNLGSLLLASGNIKEAHQAFERVLKIDEAAFGMYHPNVAIDYNNLGSTLHTLGDHNAARGAFEQSLDIYEGILGPDHPDVAKVRNNFGNVLLELGDVNGAYTNFSLALKSFQKFYPEDHSNIKMIEDKLHIIDSVNT